MKFKQKSISSNDVRHHQAGLTLLELIISISLMMLVSVGMVQLADRYSEDVKTSVVADQLKRTGDAARAYIKDNYTTIAATATSTSPYQITAAMLTAGGYLPTSSVSTNGYGQSVCTLVLEPSANKLQAMVITEGGTTIDDLTLGNIVQLAGSSSGAVLSSAPTVISGAMGGWSIPVATWHNKVNNLAKKCDGTTAGNVQVTTGHAALALWFEDGAYQSNALYRDAVAGHPELNTVNTPIIFNATQTVGAACTTSGAIANDASGVVINCTGGTWKQISSAYWADPVATYAALPTCNAAAAWATRVAKTPTTGVGPRAYTCNGTSWVALAVDDGGNLVANRGQFSRDGAGPCCGDTGTISLAESTSTSGRKANISLHNGGVHEGNIELAGAGTRRIRMYDNQGLGMGLELTGNLQLNKVETQGAGCSPNGLVARDSAGLILSCQSGVWKGSSTAPLPVFSYPKIVNGAWITCTSGPGGKILIESTAVWWAGYGVFGNSINYIRDTSNGVLSYSEGRYFEWDNRRGGANVKTHYLATVAANTTLQYIMNTTGAGNFSYIDAYCIGF